MAVLSCWGGRMNNLQQRVQSGLGGLQKFIFGEGTGQSYESVKQQRALSEQLALRASQTPRNVGEGLSAIGHAIASRRIGNKAAQAEEAGREEANSAFQQLLGGGMRGRVSTSSPDMAAYRPNAAQRVGDDAMATLGKPSNNDMAGQITALAERIGADPVDLATAISYETAGTFDPTKAGPTTQWGQHRGLIQFGEPQAQRYGVNWDDPVNSQLGEGGAIERYLLENGFQPGMGLDQIYSIINAGAPNLGHRTDENNGGAPGTVAEKVAGMGDHRAKAARFLGREASTSAAGLNPDMLALMDNPYLSEGQKGVLGMLMQQQVAAMAPPTPMTPLQQVQLQREALELENLRNAQPDRQIMEDVNGIKRYVDTGEQVFGGVQPTPEPGFVDLSPEEVAAAGYEPGSYQRGPDGRVSRIGGGGVNVTIDNGAKSSEFGEAPKDMVWLRDDSGSVVTEPDPSGQGVRPVAVPVAGGPEDNSQEATNVAQRAQDGIELIDSIINDPALNGITGMLQGRLPPMSQSGTDLNVKIQQLQGQAFLQAFESLKGGGQITQIEGVKAENAIARLNRAQSTEAYVAALNDLRGILERGLQNAGTTSSQSSGGPSQLFLERPEVTAAAEAQGLTVQQLWENMTSEQRSAWQN